MFCFLYVLSDLSTLLYTDLLLIFSYAAIVLMCLLLTDRTNKARLLLFRNLCYSESFCYKPNKHYSPPPTPQQAAAFHDTRRQILPVALDLNYKSESSLPHSLLFF